MHKYAHTCTHPFQIFLVQEDSRSVGGKAGASCHWKEGDGIKDWRERELKKTPQHLKTSIQ